MSLVKKPLMTEKKLDANRRNQRLSHGPGTAQGKGRLAAAHLHHGFYAKAQDVALRSLGEDPAHFEQLLAGLRQEFKPGGVLQEELVTRLARALWLMDRADRGQEGAALRRAKSADAARDNRLHARMMRLKMTAETLRSLARSVTREQYVTRPKDLELMKSLRLEPELVEMGEIALALFCQLQDPGAYDEAGNPVATQEAQRKVLMRVREIFGLNPDPSSPPRPGETPEGQPSPDDSSQAVPPKPNPYPHITAADWEAREPVRQLLENILTHQAEFCEALRRSILKDSVAGPSPYERAAEVAPSLTDAMLMRRMQDANMREVRRLTNLLLKIKQQEGQMETWEASDDEGVCHDLIEEKGS